MFNDIEKKMKSFAKFIAWIGITISIAGGFYMLLSGSMLGLIIIFVGPLSSWVSSWCLYGFGELIENTKIIALSVSSEKKTDKPQNIKGLTVDPDTGELLDVNL